ncbi:MAG TPA: hypothetical protein VIX90_04750 [Edaphobacter sp.]
MKEKINGKSYDMAVHLVHTDENHRRDRLCCMMLSFRIIEGHLGNVAASRSCSRQQHRAEFEFAAEPLPRRVFKKMKMSRPAAQTITGTSDRANAKDPRSAVILSARKKVLSLVSAAKHLLETRGATSGPAFFLASIEPTSWIPRIVVVRHGSVIRGILYAKERKIGIWPTGLIYADATLDSMVVSSAGDATEVFKIAIAHLLEDPRIQGLRLVIPSDRRFDVPLQEVQYRNGMDEHRSEIRHHCVLDLPESYETFLEGLGAKTRRNFRYYRRRFEAAGGEYVSEMKLSDFRKASLNLLQRGRIGAERKGLNRALRMFEAVDCRILAGLRDANGEWLAIVGGWYEADRAIVFCQMNNDTEYPQRSLSTVLRGYLFESFISKSRIEKVLFWAGIGGPLQYHCEYLPAVAVYLDRPTFVWRGFRKAFGASVQFLPEPLGSLAHWVQPTTLPRKAR